MLIISKILRFQVMETSARAKALTGWPCDDQEGVWPACAGICYAVPVQHPLSSPDKVCMILLLVTTDCGVLSHCLHVADPNARSKGESLAVELVSGHAERLITCPRSPQQMFFRSRLVVDRRPFQKTSSVARDHVERQKVSALVFVCAFQADGAFDRSFV